MNRKILLLAVCMLIPLMAAADDVHPVTGFPVIEDSPFIIFNEGVAWNSVTRIQKQQTRSNFEWTDRMVGAYFGIQTVNMQPTDSIVRIAAYYPYFSMFNGMRQFPKQTILYAFDLFAAPIFTSDMWKYVDLKFGAGLHYMYQLKDEWHMHYLGVGAYIGAEMPLSRRWTILVDGMFDWDYPNFGTNKHIQPFDYAWQYQLQLGVRYSVKAENIFSYIDSRKSR